MAVVEGDIGSEGSSIPTLGSRQGAVTARSSTHRLPWVLRAPLVVSAIALVLRMRQPGPTILTTDEFIWSARSSAFGRALATGDLGAATTGPLGSQVTRPGVTTMWSGYLGQRLSASSLPWVGGVDGLRAGQLMVGVLCVLGLWVFMVAAAPILGRRAAVVAGALLAIEPFLVGHSNVLHTDALVTMWTGAGIVALASALAAVRPEVDEGSRSTRWWRAPSVGWSLVAGMAVSLAVLTKVSALGLLVPGSIALIGLAALGVWRDHREVWARWWRAALRSLGLVGLTGTALALAAWPALWVDPMGNLGALVDTARMSSIRWPGFFLGSVTLTGDRRFYLVAAPLRTSAWLSILVLVALGSLASRRLRGRPRRIPRSISWALAVPPVAYFLLISLSSKQYGRYYLPIVPFLTLLVGTMVAGWLESLPRPRRGYGRALGWASLVAAGLWTAGLAPYSIAHVNPLLGGQEAAVGRIPLGWGEGMEWAGGAIADLSPERCPVVATQRPLFLECGSVRSLGDGAPGSPPDYVVLYVFDNQQGRNPLYREALARSGELVAARTIDGVDYVEIWDPDP